MKSDLLSEFLSSALAGGAEILRFRWRLVRFVALALSVTPIVSFSQVPSQLDFAVYATGTGCKAISISGNASVDSFDSSQGTYDQTKQPSKGIVGTSGNIDLSGNVTIYGPIFALNTTIGSCQNGTPAISLSGKAQATGGYIQLSAIPPFASVPVLPPGTTGVSRITSNVVLPPGSYGDITVSGGSMVTLSPGTYNVNSITLSGQSILTMNPVGQVTVNVAGNNVSQPIDFTGGSISNPSGVPRNFQLVYGGNLPIALSGGSMSHALLYAPNSDVSLHGGSDWFGAMTVKTLDDSGNVAIHYDRSLAVPPTISAFVEPPANEAGWNSSNVSVSFTCSDPILGVASCSSPVSVTNEGGNQVVTGTAANMAGFNATTSVTLNIDKTAPAISASVSPAANAAGWNNSNVTVTFACSDSLSGVVSCPAPVTVAGEGKNQIVSRMVVDKAGNTKSASVTISLDKTQPNVTIASPPNGSTISLSTATIGVTGSDSDTLSGVAAVTCNGGPATVSGSTFACTVPLVSGPNSVAVQATDVAGNTRTSPLALTYVPAPQVTISSPSNLSVTNLSPTTVNGTVSDPAATVKINGIPAPQSGGHFSTPVPLVEGLNILTAVATNTAGVSTQANVQVTLDTTPPHITIASPADGTSTTDGSITVTGIANDVVVGTVNAQDVQVTVNGIPAQVANRSFSAGNVPLSVGKNAIQATGVDHAGNGTTTTISVTRVLPSQPPQPAIGQAVIANSLSITSGNNQTGTIGTQLPAPLVVSLVDSSSHPVPNQTVVFKVTGNNGSVSTGGPGSVAAVVTTDANGQARVYWTLGQRSGAGSNTVQASSALAFGTANFTATGTTSDASLIVVDSGNSQTGVVGQPLPFPFVADVIDSGHNRVSGVPVTFTVKQGGGNFGGLPNQNVTSDSNGRAIAVLSLGLQEGIANNVVEATFSGNPGVPVAFAATAKAPGNPANTTISGVVFSNSNTPIQAATIRLFQTNQGNNNNLPIQIGTPVQTNAQGTFLIQSAPVGSFKLMADGSTAIGPKSYPTLEYDIVTVAGNDNTVGMPIYLPALDTVNKLCVDATHGGTLKLPQVPGFALTVFPGSATFPGGSHQGCITATPVNGDKVPMAPGFGQQPRFIVTIQPVGTTFNPPAAISLPNVDGLKPKAVTEMYSYDHDLGMFTAIGTGTVSDDGSAINSNPGVGVLKAGWHCGGDPQANGTVADCPDCNICQNNACVSNPAQEGKPCQNDQCKECKNGSCQQLTFTLAQPPPNLSFLARRSFAAVPTSDVINAQTSLDSTRDLSSLAWASSATIGGVRLEQPASRTGPTYSFVPDPGAHPNYCQGCGGSKAQSAPLSYSIQATFCTLTKDQTITQDETDIIRQEYANHGLGIPDRGQFMTPVATTHFAASDLNNTAYSIILGDPGSLAESVRSQFNSLLKSDSQLVPVGKAGLAPNTPIVKATQSIADLGTFLHTRACNGAPNPQTCDDYVIGTQIFAGPNGIAETSILTGDYGLIISSGWRNPERNEAVGGVLNSNHQQGNALDLVPSTVPYHTAAQLWCTLYTAASAVGGFAQAETGPATAVPCETSGVSHVHVQR